MKKTRDYQSSMLIETGNNRGRERLDDSGIIG